MDIRSLKYFVGIVNEGSYSEAARKLYVSQPNLSKTVKNLERKLETKLFYMEGNRTRLTEQGRQLYTLALGVIEQYDNIYDEMLNLTRNGRGTINLGIPPIIGTCVLSEVLAGFCRQYPGINLKINQKAANAIQHLVYENKLDIGFTITPVISDAFNVIPLVRDKNVIIVNRDHPLSKEKSVDYSALKNENLILLDDEYTLYGNIIAGCYDSHFEPRVLMKLAQWDLVVQMVKVNMGISILPRRILELYPEPNITMIDIDHRSSQWNVVMISKSGRYQSPAFQRFISYITQYFKENN